jgi:ribosome recycling factor
MADGVMIKIPAMTEERRRDTVKIAKNMLEDAKVSVRNARQDSLKDIKKGKDDKVLSEDDVKSYEKDLQKLVDDANDRIDEMFKKKEIDIMKI